MRRARRQAAAECIQATWRRYRARAARAAPAAPLAPARPRPAPIAGTPPPEPGDKGDPALVKRTCSLFGLDLVGEPFRFSLPPVPLPVPDRALARSQERPPPLPPSRAYTVAGGVKLGYPQQRTVGADWSEAGVRLRAGDTVLVVGAARRGHVRVQAAGRTLSVPHGVLAPARARPPPPPAPPQPAPPPPVA